MQNQIIIGSVNTILLGNRVLLRLKQLHGIEQRVVHTPPQRNANQERAEPVDLPQIPLPVVQSSDAARFATRSLCPRRVPVDIPSYSSPARDQALPLRTTPSAILRESRSPGACQKGRAGTPESSRILRHTC
jgi:hypothetical protein